MGSRYIHYLPGGGLGDVFREAYYHNAIGILKRWKLQHPQDELKVLVMSHNPSVADLFVGQDWIDTLAVRRFPVERTWDWQAAYQEYAGEFADHIELRLTLPERRSLYRADMHALRTKLGPQETLPPIGTAWGFAYSPTERALLEEVPRRLVFHPYAGQAARALSPAVREEVHTLLGDPVVIGAEYDRQEHGAESGLTLPPRLLVRVLQQAPGVVATESSVYYLASMVGTPVTMLYVRNQTFDRVRRGLSDWDWFFGLENEQNQFLPLPLTKDNREGLTRWINDRS